MERGEKGKGVEGGTGCLKKNNKRAGEKREYVISI